MRALAISLLLTSTMIISHNATAMNDYIKCSTDRQSAVTEFLKQFKTACETKNIDSLLALYGSTDSENVADARQRYSDYFSLQDVALGVDFGEAFCRSTAGGDSIRVPMRLRLDYSLNGVSQYSSEWSWLKLVDRGEGMALIGEEQARFMQTEYTDLRVELHPETGTMAGKGTLRLSVVETGPTSIVLALNRGLAVSAVAVNGSSISDFQRKGAILELPVAGGLKAADSIEIAVEFAGSLFNESEIYGYSQVSIAPEGSFASWVTHWYPRNISGSSKSRGQIEMVIPDNLELACTGKEMTKRQMEGKTIYQFAVENRQDFTFAAAQYLHESRKINGVTVGVYFLEGGQEKVDLYIERCSEILKFLAEYYGGYPYDSYYLVEIPSTVTGSLGGSSEQGMNLYPTGVLPEERVNLPLISHELSHSWWGNLVGSRSGAVISEGLAQLSAVLCVEHFEGEAEMRRFLRYGNPDYSQSAEQYFKRFTGPEPVMQDLPIGEVQLAQASVLHELADVKGHFVYEMLRRQIGADNFRDALRNIVSEYADKSVSLDDLQEAFELQSGKKLGLFFDQWFHRTGAPSFKLEYGLRKNEFGSSVRGRIIQENQPYSVTAAVLVSGPEFRRIESVEVRGRETPFEFHYEHTVDSVEFDPNYEVFRHTPEFDHIYLLAYGTKQRVDKKYEDAIKSLSDFLLYRPESLEGNYQLARAYQEHDDLELSTHYFAEVIRLYEEGAAYQWPVAFAHLNLGKNYLKQQEIERARVELEKALGYPSEKNAVEGAQELLDSLEQAR